MIKRNRKKLIIAVIFIPILYFIFYPVFHKKEYIQKYSYVELPESAKVISWHIDFHPLFGIDLPYIKLKIEGNTYNSLNYRTYKNIDDTEIKSMNHIVYNAVNPEVVEEFKCIENMGSNSTLLAGQTRLTYCVITKEISGDCYFYFYTY